MRIKQMTKKKIENEFMASEPSQLAEIYTNASLIHYNHYEFEVTFGLGSSNYEGVKPVVNVRMSPQFAKEFARIITENVRLYEQNVGKLPEDAVGKKKQ